MKQELFEKAKALFKKPFLELIFEAYSVHREHYSSEDIQKCALLSIKTGACPEDCAYCPQSARYKTGLKPEKLMPKEAILTQARAAKEKGATRFCMGAAWRGVKEGKDFDQVLDVIKAVNDEGLQVCVTLGLLKNEDQARRLKEAGVYAYNHNLDTSREYYPKIITTRTFDDRLDTLKHVRKSGMTICSGGIIGMGESVEDRASMLAELASMDPQPESVPINMLLPAEGTPLADAPPVDIFDFIRTIAVARILMPKARVRLSAGRVFLSREAHALAFMAGANSIFISDLLLTLQNSVIDDEALLASLASQAEQTCESQCAS